MSKVRIFLDLDGVVSDFSLAMCQTMGLDPLHQHLRHRLENNYMVSDEVDANSFWAKVKEQGASWWANIPMTPWAYLLYYKLVKEADVCFLSAPHDGDPASLAGKSLWIKKNFNTDVYMIGRHKEFCASPNTVLIDDYIKNIKKFSAAGGLAYHWPNPDKLRNEGGWEQEVDKAVGFVKEVIKGQSAYV